MSAKKRKQKTGIEKQFKKKFGFYPTKIELALNLATGTIINFKMIK